MKSKTKTKRNEAGFTPEEVAILERRQAEVLTALRAHQPLPYGVRARQIEGRDLFTLAIPLTDEPTDKRGVVAMVGGVAPAACR